MIIEVTLPKIEAKLLWYSAWLWLLSNAVDMLSSIPQVEGFQESNIYARHPDHSFWLYHAVCFTLVYFVMYLGVSLTLYHAAKGWNKWIAQLPAVYLFFPLTIGHFEATISNVWLTVFKWVH